MADQFRKAQIEFRSILNPPEWRKIRESGLWAGSTQYPQGKRFHPRSYQPNNTISSVDVSMALLNLSGGGSTSQLERKLWFQYGSLKGYRGCPASLGTFFPSTWKRDRYMTLLGVNILKTQGIFSQNFLNLTYVQHDANGNNKAPDS